MSMFRRKSAKRVSQERAAQLANATNSIGAKLNFSASEAYKLLRTNLNFSFTGDEKCHVLGVTSSFRGEGKTLTSINIAYTLAQAGHRVLLLECDLRLPTIAEKLNIKSKPGITECLIGERLFYGDVVQQYPGKGSTFDIITAGSTPPNPSELLGATRMTTLIETLSEVYQYIVVDLPPVSMVADPMIMSKNLFGYVMVVRHDYCERKALREAVRQLNYTDGKILGFVYNGADSGQSGYSKRYYKKYKKYYKAGYYKGSGREYGQAK